MSSAIHTTAVSQDDTASAPSAPPPAPTKSDEPSRPVEMENLAPPQPSTAPPPTSTDHPSTPAPPPDHDTSINPPGTSTPAEPAALGRSNTVESALGPEGAAPAALPPDSSEPVLRITLMLTTGARHPYTISSKYLASRKVTALDGHGNFDPREMSAYKLKELIWTDWRPEWEPKPRDPGAIRLIILGRMLEDKSQLKDLPFNLASTNVVHMTVKPADLIDDDPEGAGKSTIKSIRGRGRGGSDREDPGCCRCVVS